MSQAIQSNLLPSRHLSLPRAPTLSFASFNNKYASDSCYIIGRGQTTYDYQNLSSLHDPIFFINDAVCLESVTRSETFFFAHDPQMLPWLDGSLHSTAVLPINGKLFTTATATFPHTTPTLFYHWPRKDKESLLQLSRDQLAEVQQLYTHTGTIHSLLHFVWFCGFSHATLIGCDGISSTSRSPTQGLYDPRLQNKSQSTPAWQYATIRQAQDLLAIHLNLKTTYQGTPK